MEGRLGHLGPDVSHGPGAFQSGPEGEGEGEGAAMEQAVARLELRSRLEG